MKKRNILSIGLVISSFFLAGFILLRPKPKVSDLAENCIYSMLDGSTGSCTSGGSGAAFSPYHLDEKQQARIMREFFGRHLKGYSLSKITAEVNSSSGYGFAIAELVQGKEKARMLVPGMLYPSGPQILLASMLESLWVFERGGTRMTQLTGHDKIQFKLYGVMKDRSQLAALGIPGFYDEDGKFQNWDQVEAFYERILPLNP